MMTTTTIAACGDDGTTAPPATTSSTGAAPSTIDRGTTTSGPSTTSSPTRATPTSATQPGALVAGTIVVPNMVGQDLQLAQDSMQAVGLYALRSHDATGRGRAQVLDRNWKVCTQAPPAGSRVARDQLIDFGVVRDEEQCP